ncbi:MAG: hypothetical protein J6K17_10265 [Oscillospiraceae bacterium]|nr:hypothetical protein [Oscillospiraceae bacterium]
MKKIVLLTCIIYGVISAYIASLIYIEPMAHSYPAVERIDISYLIEKNFADYTDEDYAVVFQQTGLGKAAVKSLSSPFLLADYQESYFAEVEYICTMNSPVSFEERIEDSPVMLAPLEDGDVLITNSSHVFSWRNGHAAIVVDAESGMTLEAVVIGKNSKFQDTDKWRHYPNFVVLRLKDTKKEERAAIARSAYDYLRDIPYWVTVGFFPAKYSELEIARGTQCAHLVWLAYAAHGYDIDSDRGLIVTPNDILESDLFEVVQVYGRG